MESFFSKVADCRFWYDLIISPLPTQNWFVANHILAFFKWQRLFCISFTWNSIAFCSKSLFGFFWVYLGLFKFFWGKGGGGGLLSLFVYLVLIAAQAVNIMITPVGRVFDNLGKKFQIKSFRRFRVFVPSYKANLKRPKWRKI